MIDMDQIRERANAGSSQAKSFLRRLESRETLYRELITASMLTTAVYFVWGALRSVPSVVSLFPCSEAASRWIYVGVMIVHVLLFLIVGKVMPERAAGDKGGVFAVRFWLLMSMLLLIVKPIERLIYFTSTALMRLFRLREVEAVTLAPTEEEFLQMLEEGRDLGAIVEDNIELFANLFDFDDKIASDIMTHRTDIEALIRAYDVRKKDFCDSFTIQAD
jgi:putative hemolysin